MFSSTVFGKDAGRESAKIHSKGAMDTLAPSKCTHALRHCRPAPLPPCAAPDGDEAHGLHVLRQRERHPGPRRAHQALCAAPPPLTPAPVPRPVPCPAEPPDALSPRAPLSPLMPSRPVASSPLRLFVTSSLRLFATSPLCLFASLPHRSGCTPALDRLTPRGPLGVQCTSSADPVTALPCSRRWRRPSPSS